MKKHLTALLLTSGLCGLSHAQDSWLPDRTFTSGANPQICDNSPWKLVLFDDFNGNSLDSAKWITYGSWLGMQQPLPNGGWYYNDYCQNANSRKSGWWKVNNVDVWNAGDLDENVVVSNGTVKLKVKNQVFTAADGQTEYYTTGKISTRYYYQNQKRAFNAGKFEVRMKMPVFPKAHTTIWTWKGSYVGVNEIDMAESYGPDWSGQYGGNPFTFNRYRTKMSYPTHAWGREQKDTAPPPLPYHLDRNASQNAKDIQYPRQKYINWMAGNYLYLNDWHTYTCEWDTTVIRFYLDNELVQTMWKYYKEASFSAGSGFTYTVKVGSGCNPNGTYKVTYGFPYRRDNSNCNFNITTGVDAVHGPATSGITEMGEAEVDYVKIYQRHPELDGYSEICNSSSQITGPAYVCGTAAFSVSPPVTGGTWSVDNNSLNITGYANQGSTVYVQNNTASPTPANTALLQYQYTPDGCPSNKINKLVQNGTVSNQLVSCFQNIFPFKMGLSLQVLNPQSGTTYEWVVNYSHPLAGSHTYHAYGSSIQTPRFMHWGIFYYSVNWSLKVTNACGQRMFYGAKNALNMVAPTYGKPETYKEKDGSAIYLQTRLSEEDSITLERNVYEAVANKMVEDISDTIAIHSMIDDVYMTNLEPYIYFDDFDQTEIQYNAALPFPVIKANQTIVFPNPANNRITIILGKSFKENEVVDYQIINMKGVVVAQNKLAQDRMLNITQLPEGAYVMEVRQEGKKEQLKFQKY
ncbi:T9SS type A sorting domain-containing protein [Edaphocola aurantiacus]|uniref:T9SS type A sorting domain-containing protein n=1 Tax=Edaphocola aurantiacus TaxID=2601682 RepID=UPI001C988185|nr:T9SS type A sorting domain-containing protein [Edaphocola aurantiacus]